MTLSLSAKALAIKESATIAVSQKTKALIAAGKNIVDLSIGEPIEDTPESIKQAGIDAIHSGKTKYTNPAGIIELREAIAKSLKTEDAITYDPSQIVVGNGSKQILMNAFLALLDPGDEVIVLAPYWVSYVEQIALAGGKPIVVQTIDFQPDIGAIERAITKRTKAIVLNTPCNPSGAVFPRQALRKIAELCISHDIYAISDEIYTHYLYEGERVSIATLSKEMQERSIIVSGVSKSHFMTGWRIGFAASPPAIAKAIANIQGQTTSSASSISQYAAVAALTHNDPDPLKLRTEFRRRRDTMLRRFAEFPDVALVKPQGAFYVFPDFTEIEKDSIKLANMILEAGVAGVPGIAFGMEGHLRLNYCRSVPELSEAMDRIESFLNARRTGT